MSADLTEECGEIARMEVEVFRGIGTPINISRAQLYLERRGGHCQPSTFSPHSAIFPALFTPRQLLWFQIFVGLLSNPD